MAEGQLGEFVQVLNDYGHTYVDPVRYELPERYNLKQFPGDISPSVQSMISGFKTYIESPSIVDNSTDHRHRRDFQEIIIEEKFSDSEEKANAFRSLLMSNKLKRNSILANVFFAEGVKARIKKQKLENDFQPLISLIDDFNDFVREKVPGGKSVTEETAEVISMKIVNILNFLGVPLDVYFTDLWYNSLPR